MAIVAPSNLTKLEREAFEWALAGLQNSLMDPGFLEDNPGFENDCAAQRKDFLWRLEQMAPDAFTDNASPEDRQFAKAAPRAARKFRQSLKS